MKPDVSIDSVRAQAFEIPTDKPEADGTISWNSTTLVLVQISGGGKIGIGYTYSSASIVELICGKLATTIEGSDAFNPQAAWLAMQRAVRNLGREGLAATAISAVDTALYDLKARVLGIPLLRGRLFEDRDAMDSPHVAVISESVARERWPNQEPLGRRALAVGTFDRLVHLPAGDEVQLHQDVRQAAAGTATPARRGHAVALLGPLGARWCPGLCWRIHWLAMAPAASRIAWRGAACPVQRSNDAAPWATRISRPSITSAPRVLAASRSRVPPSR